MTIAILINSLVGGGSERFAALLANGLSDRGYAVSLLTGPRQPEEFELNEKVNRVELFSHQSFPVSSILLHRYLNSQAIDVCIAIGIQANLTAALANFMLKTRIVLCERNAPKEDHLSWKSKLLRKLLYRQGDAFVFQTPDAQAFYNQTIQRRGVVIPNPVKEGLPRRSDSVRKEIVAVGRLRPQKNYPLLLTAFSKVHQQHPDYQLRIFGRGNCLAELQTLTQTLHLQDAVTFEGFRPDVHPAISGSDIFVLSSDFEGMPNALMEAMAMGFPVVSTDCPCGGPRMLITDRENGLLTKVGDAADLVRALNLLIEDPVLKEQCARQALRIKETYALREILLKWETFLNRLV